MRARMELDYKELQVIIEHMIMKQGEGFGHHGMKAKTDERSSRGALGEALLRKQCFDEEISEEEAESVSCLREGWRWRSF